MGSIHDSAVVVKRSANVNYAQLIGEYDVTYVSLLRILLDNAKYLKRMNSIAAVIGWTGCMLLHLALHSAMFEDCEMNDIETDDIKIQLYWLAM